MPDARLHFRSPAWQSLPVAGLPPAAWPEPARRLRSFFDRCIPLQALYQPARTSNVPVPVSSALIETFAVHLLLGTLALAQVPAAFLLAAPETDPVIRRTAVRFGTLALLAMLIEIDYHRRLPPPFPGPSSAS